MIKNWKDLPWFDFLKVMKDEPIVVKDAFGFGLKAIATNLEKHGLITTTWEDGPADGLGAMVGAWYCDRISKEQGIDSTMRLQEFLSEVIQRDFFSKSVFLNSIAEC